MKTLDERADALERVMGAMDLDVRTQSAKTLRETLRNPKAGPGLPAGLARMRQALAALPDDVLDRAFFELRNPLRLMKRSLH